MAHIVLNRAAVDQAAASIGIFDQEALVEHLGMEITEPASVGLVSTIVTRLPLTMSMAFLVATAECGLQIAAVA